MKHTSAQHQGEESCLSPQPHRTNALRPDLTLWPKESLLELSPLLQEVAATATKSPGS